MKIAYLINQYPAISHSFIRREILALERIGVDIKRFSIRKPKQTLIANEDMSEAAQTTYVIGAPLTEIIRALGLTLIFSPLRVLTGLASIFRLGWNSETGLLRHFVYFAEAMVLASWLRGAAITHLHAHFGTNSAVVALMASALARCSFSFTIHGPEEFDKPGLIHLKEKIEAAAFVVAISNYGRSQLRRIVSPDHWNKINLVHCGVEEAFYERADVPLPNAPHFVCVGRYCEQKGLFTLIEAAALLKEKGVALKVTMVGDGELRAQLEAAMRDLNVVDQIVLAGWKTPAEVCVEIENARAFILPSYAEGLPVSIMEAFLLSRPVISTYIAGIPELVEPGVNGWLTPASDAAALAEAILEAINADAKALMEMGRRGKMKTLQHHHIDIEAAKLKHHFFELTHHTP